MLDKVIGEKRMKIAILDCYIDEPTCLGVPPYISPYPRYIAGAIWSVDKSIDVRYLTIDDLRKGTEKSKTIEEVEILVVIAGMIVPGKYLSTYPAHPKEIRRYLENLAKPVKILCGPAAIFGFGIGGGSRTRELGELFDFVVKGDPEIFIRDFLKEGESADLYARRESAKEIRNFAIKGAEIVKQHQNHPDYLIAEIEKKGLTDDIPHVCTHGKDCNFECIDACKFDAMKKKDGIVYVDYDKCVGCGACERACPINAVWIFEKKAYKCDLCQGEPRCVKVCSQGALEIGGA